MLLIRPRQRRVRGHARRGKAVGLTAAARLQRILSTWKRWRHSRRNYQLAARGAGRCDCAGPVEHSWRTKRRDVCNCLVLTSIIGGMREPMGGSGCRPRRHTYHMTKCQAEAGRARRKRGWSGKWIYTCHAVCYDLLCEKTEQLLSKRPFAVISPDYPIFYKLLSVGRKSPSNSSSTQRQSQPNR